MQVVACRALSSYGHPFVALTWASLSRQSLAESKSREVLVALLTPRPQGTGRREEAAASPVQGQTRGVTGGDGPPFARRPTEAADGFSKAPALTRPTGPQDLATFYFSGFNFVSIIPSTLFVSPPPLRSNHMTQLHCTC